LVARASIALGYLAVAADRPYWVESRPEQGGRHVIVTPAEGGGVAELTPPGFNARSRVHEYGGMPFAVCADTLYFSNFTDQVMYAQRAGAAPCALTMPGHRYADYDADAAGARLFCVREDHGGGAEPVNAIVSVSTAAPHAQQVLFSGSDFVAYPRISADGRRLAWIAWNHPDMPWDSTRLYVAELAAGADGASVLGATRVIAGGPDESVLEPRWDADGTLYFISDRSGWWNLYRWRGREPEPVLSMTAELAEPLWNLGQVNYVLTGDGRAVVRYATGARDRLATVDLSSAEVRTIELPFVSYSGLALWRSGTQVLSIAASPTAEPAVIAIDLRTHACRVLRDAGPAPLDAACISVAESIEYPTAGGLCAHAFYYPPVNPAYMVPPGEKPPLVVKVHGGPTSHAKPAFSLMIQYWTTRGFAVLDVNHGGSSGFGRAYRRRLDGAWGVVDVQDVVAAVRALADQGRIDPERAVIRGGSAGGFTVLAALAFHDVFKAGANYYGVSDLEALARDTHKFESRYLDRLVAPLPQGRAIYQARAPIRHLDGFRAPLITFQGSEDRIVPPGQSQQIVAALRQRGVPVVYLEFEGEQHGFRKADNIARALEAELAFYGQVFGFEPAGPLPPLPPLPQLR
jgi:dipeptidyl aminopeptidase/acylaminoacyl peptidase